MFCLTAKSTGSDRTMGHSGITVLGAILLAGHSVYRAHKSTHQYFRYLNQK